MFEYALAKDGIVRISWTGRNVTTLVGHRAIAFLARVAGADEAAAQLAMARVTGNFRRGNERRPARR